MGTRISAAEAFDVSSNSSNARDEEPGEPDPPSRSTDPHATDQDRPSEPAREGGLRGLAPVSPLSGDCHPPRMTDNLPAESTMDCLHRRDWWARMRLTRRGIPPLEREGHRTMIARSPAPQLAVRLAVLCAASTALSSAAAAQPAR